jgi:hypothetical protein
MQNGSSDWNDSERELGFLAALAVVGTVVSGLVMSAWGPAAAGRAMDATDIVDQGMHNLSPGFCHATVTSLLDEFRNDPRVLWVWVEQSAPALTSLTVMSKETGVLRDAPRPYAFRPDVKELPAGICGFERNSVHALSLGGAAGSVLAPEPNPVWADAGL